MASSAITTPAAPGHRRNKSSSVLKSIIGNHKRSESDATALNKNPTQNIPIAPQETKPNPPKGLHKRTKSAISLRSLGRPKENKDINQTEAQEPTRTREGPKKTKSSRNLAAMFGKSKPKDGETPQSRDKENTTPPSSAAAPGPARTPGWGEFPRQPFQEISSTSKVPLNDRRSVEEEIARYTPSNYPPSKQRDFFEHGVPTLQKRPVIKERPKSTFLPSTNSATSFLDNLSRKRSNDRVPLADTKGNARPKDMAPPSSRPTRDMLRRSNSDSGKRKNGVEQPAPAPKRPNRVMAAVAALNGRSKDSHAAAKEPAKLDPQAVEAEFEHVLVSLHHTQAISFQC